MIQPKLISYWRSLQERERKLLKIVSILLPIFLLIFYFFNLSESISSNQQQLNIAKDNFNYVYQKANKLSAFSKAQQEIQSFKSIPEFLIYQSSEFDLINFSLMEDGETKFLKFNHSSMDQIGYFFEKIIIHPKLSVQSIQISSAEEIYTVKAFYL